MKKIILTIFILSALALPLMAIAGPFDQVAGGLSETGEAAGFNPNDDGTPARDLATAFSAYATGLAGILSALFIILIIYAGWIWMTAQGNEEKATRSKKIIVGSVIGIVFVIAARILGELVIFTLTRIITGS